MLEPTTRPTGSKPACSTYRYSFTERSDVNSPRAFILRRSLACSARPSVLVGSYVDIKCSPGEGVGLDTQVDRHDGHAERGWMRLVRAEADGGAQHVHGNDEEVRSEERRVGKECRSRW